MPHEECPQVSPSANHSEPGRDNVGVQQVDPDCQPLVTIQTTDINPYLVNENPPQPVGDIKSNSSRWLTFTQCRNRSESMLVPMDIFMMPTQAILVLNRIDLIQD